jgi:MoaA/NifB/PqqE/SkfB family radical SAM enzyme
MITPSFSWNADLAKTINTLARWAKLVKARDAARIFYQASSRIDPDNRVARRQVRLLRSRSPEERTALRYVVFGTTGLCNASCIHCPTGKAITSHVPRSTMELSLFKDAVDRIFEEGWALLGIHFGLFGDGLVDPHVVERARYAREWLPEIMLDVNTNGAAFDRKRHAPLNDDLTLLTLHCESIRPDTYDRIMTPLRAKNVFPKYEPILDAFPGKVRVSMPVSRLNIDEIDETRDWFLTRGAREVVFDPLASRCTEDQSLFHQIAFTPVEIR